MSRAEFVMLDQISHRAALVGQAIDQLSKVPLEGVEVTIVDGPSEWIALIDALRSGQPARRADLSLTDANGFFKYLDLPPGEYVLRASLAGNRYASASGIATVTKLGATIVELALAPTALIGMVKANVPSGPLAMARVRVAGSGEVAFTASDGTYVLSPLEAGTARIIEISAQRYLAVTQTATLQAGKTLTAPPITLTHS